jgi:hypothetical protein
MSDAQIIPFPRSPAPPVDQLSAAMIGLSSALMTDQQTAIDQWRRAVSDLAGSMQILSSGLAPLNVPPGPSAG